MATKAIQSPPDLAHLDKPFHSFQTLGIELFGFLAQHAISALIVENALKMYSYYIPIWVLSPYYYA